MRYDAALLVFNESRCKHNQFQENLGYNIDGVGYETAQYDDTGATSVFHWTYNVAYYCKHIFYKIMA